MDNAPEDLEEHDGQIEGSGFRVIRSPQKAPPAPDEELKKLIRDQQRGPKRGRDDEPPEAA